MASTIASTLAGLGPSEKLDASGLDAGHGEKDNGRWSGDTRVILSEVVVREASNNAVEGPLHHQECLPLRHRGPSLCSE